MVGAQECATGVVPAPPSAPPWNSANCPNYGQYAFVYRIAIGNSTRWTSKVGNPATGVVRADGTVAAADISSNTSNRAVNMGSGGVVTLSPGTFALISEMYVDVSNLNLFSIWTAPIIYSRTVT